MLSNAAVLFDFGGTLDAEGLPWKDRFFGLCRDAGLAVSRETFDRVFYAADDALVGTIPRTLSFADTVQCLARGVVDALGGASDEAARHIARRFVDATRSQIEANRLILTRLHSRYRLGIVSNFYGNLAAVCDNLDLQPLFSVIVDSSVVGFSKPDPRIFQHAMDELDLTPAAAIFVGDSFARDMAGARAVGMRHIWLAGDGADASRACCPGDHVIRSLGDVETVLL